MTMRFEKWQALGNDYLILERAELPFELTPARVRRLCEGHFGVFADGVLLLSPAERSEHVASLRIFNPDGSEAELSGNGAREAILYLYRRGWTRQKTFAIGTPAGEIRPRITGPDTCTRRVWAGRCSAPRSSPRAPPTGAARSPRAGASGTSSTSSIGNPQCAIHVASEPELAALDLDEVGPAIEGDAQFPNRTNVSWYTELDSDPAAARASIRARIFERGVGETLSSGTGATGAAVAHVVAHGGGPAGVGVLLDGGELTVDVGADLSVDLTGWARPVFAGRLSEDFQKELHETE